MSIKDKLKGMRKAVAEKIYTAPPVPKPEVKRKPIVRMVKSDCKSCKCRMLTGHPCHRLESIIPHTSPRTTEFDSAIQYFHVDDDKTRTTRMCEKYMAMISFCVEMNVDQQVLQDPKTKMNTIAALERHLHNKIHEKVYGDACAELHKIQRELLESGSNPTPIELHELSRRLGQLINKLSGN